MGILWECYGYPMARSGDRRVIGGKLSARNAKKCIFPPPKKKAVPSDAALPVAIPPKVRSHYRANDNL